MKTLSMIAAVLVASTLAGGAQAAGPAKKKPGAAGPVCVAMGTLARSMAEGRDLGRTEEQARELSRASSAKITVTDTSDMDKVKSDLITMVYHDPQVKDSDPINAEIRGSEICMKHYGAGY